MAKKKKKGQSIKAVVGNLGLQTDEAGVIANGRVLDNHPSNRITPAKLKSILEDAENGDITAQQQLFLDIEEQDSAIISALQTRKRATLTLDWVINAPYNATEQEEKWVDEVRELFHQIGYLDDLVIDCMDAVGHGFSALEIQWQRIGEKWFPKGFIHRSPTWFKLDEHDNLLLKSPNSPMGEPLNQFGWVVHKHKNRSTQLARNGLFRTLAWLYMFKHYAIRDFAEFLELYGFPIRIGKYGAGATEGEKNSLKRALRDIGHNASGIMPDSMQIELHNVASGTSATSNPFLQMADWCEKSAARLILGQTLTSGSDGKTSTNALGTVHNEVRRDLLVSDAKQLSQTITQQIILPYLLINVPNVDPHRIPQFEFDTKEPEDIQAFADALPKLVDIGVPVPVNWVTNKLGIPVAQEGEAILKRLETDVNTDLTPKALSAKHPKGCQCGCSQAVGLSSNVAKQDIAQTTLDDELENAFGQVDFNRQLDPMVQAVVALLHACHSYEEAGDKLAALYPQLSSEAYERYLANGLFLSELLGVHNAER